MLVPQQCFLKSISSMYLKLILKVYYILYILELKVQKGTFEGPMCI